MKRSSSHINFSILAKLFGNNKADGNGRTSRAPRHGFSIKTMQLVIAQILSIVVLFQAVAPMAIGATNSDPANHNNPGRRSVSQRNGTLKSMTPTRANQGQRLNVTLKGLGTKWAANQTRVSFGGEISVGGAAAGDFGPVQVTDDSTAIAEIIISPTAALGLRSINVSTAIAGSAQPEVEAMPDSFTVTAVKTPGSTTVTVSTMAGLAHVIGANNGAASQARFRNPTGIAVGADDTIYVADSGNNSIRKISNNGIVTTLAGDGLADYADGTTAAHFNNPQGVAVDANGIVYVADTNNHRIRRIAVDGTVTTIAGDGNIGLKDGVGATAQFNAPRGIAVDSHGTLYVADTGNSAVRSITPTGEVRTITGDGKVGSSDSPSARFNGISGVAVDGDDIYIYLADAGNHRIRRLDSSGTVITVAGAERGYADGKASQARFAEPSGIAVNKEGRLIVTDTINSLVRSIDPALAQSDEVGAVTTIAGAGERGTLNGAGNLARFDTPRGVAVTSSGAIVIADTGNHTIRRIVLPPAIAFIDPNKAGPEAAVTINGERFDARSPERNMVRFTRKTSGQTSATVIAATATQLIVTVPADAATGKVSVQTEGGIATSSTNFEVGTTESGPVIADFNPKSGAVGDTVTITGTSLKAKTGDVAITFAGANGTRIPAFVITGSTNEMKVTVPNGVTTGVIELRNALGLAHSKDAFSVKTSDEFVVTAAPTSVQTMQNTNAVYMLSMSSPKSNFRYLAKLDITGLPGKARAKFEPPSITAGENSSLTIDLNNSDVTPGTYSLKVTATVNIQGNTLIQEVPLSLTVTSAGGQTSLSGRVLSIDNEPVPGVTVSMDGRSAVTDAAGKFLLSGVTPGLKRALKVDGKTASTPGRTYPTVVEPAKIIAGQANTSPYIFYLPIVDTQHEINIIPNQDTIVTTPRVPGIKLMIPAQARPTNRDGSPATRVSITPVPPDRIPSPLPAGVKVSMIYTNQPGGATSKEPMPITFPNLAGDNPGTRLPIYEFNHDDVEWQIVGYGIVSKDGRTIEPDTDSKTGKPYGLMDFSWFGVGIGTSNVCPTGNCPRSRTNTPVDLANGIKIEESTDISFGGARGGITLIRTYTSDLDARPYTGDFGRGTKHNYELLLTGTFLSGGSGRITWPDDYNGRLFSYDHTETDGTLIFKSTALSELLGDIVRRLPNGNLEYRTAQGIVMAFNSNGRISTITDPNGNVTTLSYTSNKLSSITDPVGRSVTFTYTSNLITRATDPIGRHWDYTYDSAFRISTVTDPLGKTMSYTYTGNALTKVTDKRGNAIKQIAYGGSTGNISEQRFADGGFERYSNENLTTTITKSSGRTVVKRFNAAGYVIEETDELGQHSRIIRDITTNLPLEVIGHCGCSELVKTFDARGNILTQTDELGQTTTYEYEAVFNNVTQKTDKLNKVTTFTYDSHGNLLTKTNALNQTVTYTYDQYGQTTSMTDALNHTWTFDYDNKGNLISKKDPLNNEMTMEYDGIGRMTAMEDPMQRRTEMTYDGMSRVLTKTLPNSAVITYAYDDDGNRISLKDDLNNEWKLTYDAKSRPVLQTDPLHHITRVEYNTDDELITAIAPSNRTIRYTYTARGQIATVTDPLNGTLNLTYDKDKNLVTLSDLRGNATTFLYDELDRLIKVINPLGQATSMTYNAMNRKLTTTDSLNRTTTFTYDALHRRSTIEYIDATVTYSYNAAGRTTSISDSVSGDITRVYDNANRLLSETSSEGTLTYTYNAASQKTSMTAANEPTVYYGYDTAGRLSTITQGMEVFTYGYDVLSRRTSLDRPNGVKTTYSYDGINRLTRIKHQKGSDPALEDLQYTYDDNNEINSITSLYSTPTLPTANNSISAANEANRIAQFGSASYSFNNMGQPTSKSVTGIGTTDYQWDHRGRLTKVTLPSSQEITYVYDALGRRKSRTVGGITTTFMYDRKDVVLDTVSTTSTSYLNGPLIDEKLKQTDTSGSSYFTTDHLLSITSLLDNTGAVTERIIYDAFGNTAGSSSTRYGFTGRELDSLSGLTYYRARWYVPEQGRFLSEDPIGFKGGFNFYQYAGSNPTNRRDPMGLSAFSIICNFVLVGLGSYVGGLAGGQIAGALAPVGGGPLIIAFGTGVGAIGGFSFTIPIAQTICGKPNCSIPASPMAPPLQPNPPTTIAQPQSRVVPYAVPLAPQYPTDCADPFEDCLQRADEYEIDPEGYSDDCFEWFLKECEPWLKGGKKGPRPLAPGEGGPYSPLSM